MRASEAARIAAVTGRFCAHASGMSDATRPFVSHTLTMITEERQGVLALVPVVDRSSLIELVGAYESAQGFTPAGACGGLIPA